MRPHRKLLFREVCPQGEQIHIRDTVLRGPSRTTPHTHDFREFFLVRSGTVRHHVNGRSIDMAPGSLCVAGPADEHCYQGISGAAPAVFTNVAVAPELPSCLGSVVPPRFFQREKKSPPALAVAPPWFGAKLDMLRAELDSRTPSSERQRLLAATLLSDVVVVLTGAHSFSQSASDTVPPWLRRALHRMEQPEHYTAGLHRFLELCGKSQEYISRTTRRHLNRTPTELVNGIRLREAARLLRDSDDAILSIALRTGFNNISHFLTQFRKRYGCTPRAYRRHNRMVIDPSPASRRPAT